MWHARVGFGIVLAALAGCSGTPDLIVVTGTVKIDGVPAEGVQVSFWPADEAGKNSRNRYAAGKSGKDGRFALRSVAGEGVEAGEYKVTFSRMLLGGKAVPDPKKKVDNARESLPEKYTSQDGAEVKARVTRDDHDFVFDLSLKSK